jgi:hypothetical protein
MPAARKIAAGLSIQQHRNEPMTNRENIEDAYAAAHIRALTLLENLHERVEDLPAPGNNDHPIDWGHVGSLNHLCEQLAELKKQFALDED